MGADVIEAVSGVVNDIADVVEASADALEYVEAVCSPVVDSTVGDVGDVSEASENRVIGCPYH